MNAPNSHSSPRISAGQSAFSLIELLVVVGVIAVLASLVGAFWKRAVSEGEKAQELAAGKTLGAAYQAYATENNGELMPGYTDSASTIELPQGESIHGEAANRYIWRLAPYFNYDINSVIYGKQRGVAQSESEQAGAGYGQSLALPYGINAYFVGGYYEQGTSKIPAIDIATRIVQVQEPSNLLVFATARSSQGKGNFIVKAPRHEPRAPGTAPLGAPDWPSGDSPASSGNVDFRHSGKALCVFLDGSIRSYDREELLDMQLWSMNAAAEGNQNYAPTLEGGSGGRGGGRNR